MKTKELIARLGGPSIVGKVVGVSHSAVCQWTRIPAHHCAALANWSAMQDKPVSREEMRPDLWPPEG